MAHLHELTVRGAEHEYPVIVGPGVLSAALPDLVARGRFSRVAIVTNTRLAPLYGLALADRLPGACLITLPDGEQYKTMDSLARLYGELLAAGVDRSGLVIALGGGVIGDLAGFAAATFMRGVALIQAPTSLLAMVDASIGGKVGVDLPQGKNLAGAFKDPLAVFADTDTLATLPPVERRCGLAEVVKSALIADPALLEELSADPLPPDDTIITRTARVKIALVNQDRTEQGVRAFLNLGHTFAHAIEQVSGYAWKHGEAVAVGLVGAARLSERLGLVAPGLSAQVESVLRRLELPTRYEALDPGDLWAAMSRDKKWRGGTATFVLLEGVGRPRVERNVSAGDALAVLEELRA